MWHCNQGGKIRSFVSNSKKETNELLWKGFGRRKYREEQTQTKPASVEASKSTDAPNDMDNAGDDNDDLDDFFASLS